MVSWVDRINDTFSPMVGGVEALNATGAPVRLIRFERPEHKNAFNRTMFEDLSHHLRVADADPEVGAVVLTGSEDSFSSGVDKSWFAAGGSALDRLQGIEGHIQAVARALLDIEVPVIAAVNGVAVGGGLDLALWCDLRIAAESATFAAGYINHGIAPGGGAAFLLPGLIGEAAALEFLLSGERRDAGWALHAGVVTSVVSDSELIDVVLEIAGRWSTHDRAAVRTTKRLIRSARSSGPRAALEHAAANAAVLAGSPRGTSA